MPAGTGVGGENAGLPDVFLSFFDGFAFAHELADTFEGKEGGMTFVHVENRWLVAQALQRPESADAQQHFLRDAQFGIADVKAVRELAILLVVFGDVGVHQDELIAPDVELVEAGVKIATWQLNRDFNRVALFVVEGDQGQVVIIELDVAGFLPAIFTDLARSTQKYKENRLPPEASQDHWLP